VSYDFNAGSRYLHGTFSATKDVPLTIVAWIKCSAASWANTSKEWAVFFSDGTTAESYSLAKSVGTADEVTAVSRTGDSDDNASETHPDTTYDDTWVMIVGVFTSDSLRDVYVENSNETSQAIGARNVSLVDEFRIGANNSGFSNFEGLIAEVAVFDVALTQGQIDALQTGPESGIPPADVAPDDCIGYWSLDTDQASHTDESSGAAGPTLTVTNAVFNADHPTITAITSTSHGIVHSETRITAIGTKEYIKPGIGAPKLSLIYASRNPSVNTDLDDFMATFGAINAAASEQFMFGSAYEDAVSTTDGHIWQTTLRALTSADPGSSTSDCIADFDSAITDGVKLDFTTVESTARRMAAIHLIEGIDQVAIDYVTTVNDGSATVTVGFQADILICFSNDATLEPGQSNQFRESIGFYHRVDDLHRMIAWAGHGSSTTPQVACASDSTEIMGTANYVGSQIFSLFQAQNFTSTSYDIFDSGGSSEPQIGVIAIKLATGYSAKVGHFSCPVTTGVNSVISGLSFQPQFAFLNTVGVTTQDSHVADECQFSVGACDADDQIAAGGVMQDFTSANNSNAVGWHRDDSCIYIKGDDAALKVKAAFDSFQTDGLDLNFSTATTGWGLITNYLLIGKDPVGGGGAPLFANHLNQMQRN